MDANERNAIGVYDAGIFLDNEKSNVETVGLCGPKMKTVLVPSKPNPYVTFQSYELYNYVSSLSPKGKEAAITIQMMGRIIGDNYERYDEGSGIQPSHVEEVKKWVIAQRDEDPHKRLVAFFDWDRTLTIMEGFYSFGQEGLAGFPAVLEANLEKIPALSSVIERWDTMTPEAVTEYYCGGPERVKMLQDMFDFLYNEDVDNFVLTYNPTCVTNRRLLEDMMHVLTKGRQVGYLCANKLAGYDKKNAIQKNVDYGIGFTYICPDFTGGSKKKNMKKHMTRKKLKRRNAK